MPGAARLADVCTGHPRHPSRPCISGSQDVLINGRPALRVGDAWAGHPHGSVQASGSSSVFVNGMPLARIGDAVACGSLVATGSGDVLVGG